MNSLGRFFFFFFSVKLPSILWYWVWFSIPLGNQMIQWFSYDCSYNVISFIRETYLETLFLAMRIRKHGLSKGMVKNEYIMIKLKYIVIEVFEHDSWNIQFPAEKALWNAAGGRKGCITIWHFTQRGFFQKSNLKLPLLYRHLKWSTLHLYAASVWTLCFCPKKPHRKYK